MEWKEIDVANGKPNSKGEVKILCPKCSHTRKKKKDPCLSVNITLGVAFCWNCGETSTNKGRKQKDYELPSQNWGNHTELSDNVVKWFKSRSISQKTLLDCRITEEKFYQPAKKEECNNIVFNYFYGVALLNKKFRSSDKKFTQCKNAKKVFYGINDLEGYKECYIVEGEIDKLSFYEVGYKNCISVPNGANDLNDVFETCGEELKKIDKYFIAVDNDEAGKKLELALINRLGKWKCSKIEFVKGKDANDELISSKLDLLEAIKNPIDYPVEGTFTTKDFRNEVFELYNNGDEETIKPKGYEWAEFNNMFSILMGQLTVVTGIPSHGKSNFIEWYVLELVRDYPELKASFFSPEHLPVETHIRVLTEKVVGSKFDKNPYRRMTGVELEEGLKWMDDKVYFTAPDKGKRADWDWLLDRFREQCFKYGANVFIIDAFNKVKRKNGESLSEVSDILADITTFCQAYNVHVFLIAHPKKMPKNDDGGYNVPDLYDVKGNSEFYDQTHNGLAIHRLFNDDNEVLIKNLKVKFKHQGAASIGESVNMKFNLNNNRYFVNKENNDPLYGEVKNIQTEIQQVKSDIELGRLNALSKQSGYPSTNLPMNEEFYDDVPF